MTSDETIGLLLQQCKELTSDMKAVASSQAALSRDQAVLSSRLEDKMTGLDTKVDELGVSVADLTRTLRGFNGTPGLVTQMAILRSDVDRVVADKERITPDSDSKDSESKFISWRYLIDKVALPLVITLVIWTLLTFIPDVLTHVNIATVSTP